MNPINSGTGYPFIQKKQTTLQSAKNTWRKNGEVFTRSKQKEKPQRLVTVYLTSGEEIELLQKVSTVGTVMVFRSRR